RRCGLVYAPPPCPPRRSSDLQRFYRYGILTNPQLRIYKPWLDNAFVSAFGGRKEMSEYLNSVGLPYSMSTEKAYSTDANVLGARSEEHTSELQSRENLVCRLL